MEEVAQELDLDYQPLSVGRFWVYEVSETIYYGASDSEEKEFFYRDEVASQYFNEEGEQVFLLVRKQSVDQIDWLPVETFTYRITERSLVKSRGNQQSISLVFPVTDKMEWDGNVLNTVQEDIYNLQLFQSYTVADLQYSNVAKVLQHQEDDLIILRNHRYEVFVRGLGLVESYYEVLQYCSRNDCLGQQLIESGRLTHLTLLKNG